MELSTLLKNNLYSGNTMVVELPPKSSENLCFMVFGSYQLMNGIPVRSSKFLGSNVNLRFWYRIYEIKKEYISLGYDLTPDECEYHVYFNDLPNLESIMLELRKLNINLEDIKTEHSMDNPF